MKAKSIALLLVVSLGANASAISDVLKSKAESDLQVAIKQLQDDFKGAAGTSAEFADIKKEGRVFYGYGVKVGEAGKVSCLKAKRKTEDEVVRQEIKGLVDNYKGSDDEKALLTTDITAIYSALLDHMVAGCMSKRM